MTEWQAILDQATPGNTGFLANEVSIGQCFVQWDYM